MNQREFEQIYQRQPLEKCKFPACIIKKSRTNRQRISSIFSSLTGLVPIFQWLPKYQWKTDLTGDIIGGLTVGIMHVPQGMAYASLASLPPVHGLYTSFFAAFIYMFFGTARHISIGVFAVSSLMVGGVRLRFLPEMDQLSELGNHSHIMAPLLPGDEASPVLPAGITPLMLTSSLTLLVGLIQIAMGIFHLGFLTTYMSDALIAGFTTGSACHVFMSQVNKVLGVKLPRHEGFGMLIKMLIDLVYALPKTNYWAVGISIFGIVFLSVGRDYVNPWVKKRVPVPLPLELILVIIGTLFSVCVGVKENYGVQIVNNIPRGIPEMALPRVDLFRLLIGDAIGIAIICYMFIVSMGKLFAKKHKYRTDATQELYAIGIAECLSSVFPVYPCGASLSRSAVCEQSGAKTQLNTLFSSILLLAVILWLGPLLEPLPMCILACIVMVSLKSLFMQFNELPRLWRTCKYDFAIWLVSFFATALNSVTTGLLISVTFTVFTIVLRSQWPKMHIMSYSSEHRILKPQDRYPSMSSSDSVKIVRFESSLNFANVVGFLDAIADLLKTENGEVQNNGNRVEEALKSSISRRGRSSSQIHEKPNEILSGRRKSFLEPVNEHLLELQKLQAVEANRLQALVMDCSAIVYVDTMGIDALKEIYNDANKANVAVYYAAVCEPVLDILETSDFFATVNRDQLYPSVNHAVRHCSKLLQL